MSYPKWVSRGIGLGDILCTCAEDEAAVVADNDARQSAADKAAAQEAQAAQQALDEAAKAKALAAQQAADEADAVAAAKAEELVQTIASLRAQLDAAGIPYDKRLGVDRLRALLPV